jgi:hypothetical protein
MSKVSMAYFFKSCGVDYTKMKIGEKIDVSFLNRTVKSFNVINRQVEDKRVITLVRKEDVSTTISVWDKETSSFLFSASPAHRVCRIKEDKEEWVALESIIDNPAIILKGINHNIPIKLSISGSSPILDFEVEDNHNYFSNDILSHNTTPGGNAVKYYASIRLDVRKVEYITGKDEDDFIGLRSRVTAKKNKTSVPNRKGEIEIYFSRGIDPLSEYFDFALSYDVIKKTGNTYTYKDEKLGVGKNNAVEALRKWENIYNEIKEKVDSLLINVNISDSILAPEEIEPEEAGASEEEIAALVNEAEEIIVAHGHETPPITNNLKRRGRPSKK